MTDLCWINSTRPRAASVKIAKTVDKSEGGAVVRGWGDIVGLYPLVAIAAVCLILGIVLDKRRKK
jgi:hypothetical protein